MKLLIPESKIKEQLRQVEKEGRWAFQTDPDEIDEEELGCTEPGAFKLAPEHFKSPLDYVRSFVSEVRKLHTSDAKNELRRKESLGRIFKTENLQPRALRTPLLDETGNERAQYFLTAMVPILKENYQAMFNGTKRPAYNLQSQAQMKDKYIFGVLTAEDPGLIPSVTICEQLNDLRVDPTANNVVTYLFKQINSQTMRVEVQDPAFEVQVIKSQLFEEHHKYA